MMEPRTPAQWLREHQKRAAMFAINEPADYFLSGNGAMWLLLLADGIRALQAYCLSTTRPVLLIDKDGGASP